MSISGLMWWKSEVNFSPFPDLAACRIRSSACVTLSRLCVRHVLCCSGVPSVPALRSARSASSVEDLFAGFIANNYFPHLDPAERLWGLMHKHVTHNRCHATFADFKQAILTFLREEVPRKWGIYCDRVTDNFRIISPGKFRVLH